MATSPRPAPDIPAAAWFLGAALVAVLCLWVAASGPVFVVGKEYVAPQRPGDDQATSLPRPTGPVVPQGEESARGDGASPVVAFIVWLLLIGLAVGLALLAYRLWQERRLPRPAPPVTADVATAVLADAHEQLAALAAGPPSDGIIACWLMLEESVSAAGVSPLPWQTSAEFTADILRELDVDDDALTRLADLYREARFSTHVMGEDARAQAREALGAIHDRLAAGAQR